MSLPERLQNLLKSELLRIDLDGFLIVVGSVAFMAVLRYMLQSFLGLDAPYMLFFLPILVSTLRSGFLAGILAIVLSGIVTVPFIHQYDHEHFHTLGHMIAMILFFVEAFTLVVLSEMFRRNRWRAKEVDRKASSISQALRSAETRLRNIVQSSILGTIVYHRDGRILDCNDAFLDMLGYTRAELKSGKLTWSALTPPDVLELDRRRLSLPRTGKGLSFEKEYLHKDGHRVPVFIAASDFEPDSDDGVAFVVDLSELKRTKQALAKSEERHLLATTLGGIGTWEWDLETDKLSWSDNLFRLFGYTDKPEVMRSGVFFDRIHSDDRVRAQKNIEAAIDSKVEYYDEFRIQLPSGDVRWIAARGRALYDPNGKAYRMAGVNYDISRRKFVEFQKRDTEAALAHSEERLNMATSLACIGTWDLTLGQKAVFSNVERQLLGWSESEEVTEEKFYSAVHPDDRAELKKNLQAALESGSDVNTEFRILKPNGQVRWLAMRGRALRSDTKPTRMLGVNYDITEHKQALSALREGESQMEKALREAQAANQMKDQFLATLSHELRTPLNAILGWAELSQTMDRNSELFNKAIETIYRNAKLQTEMINDLLDLARILNGKFSIAVQEVDLTDIIMDAVESCRLSAQAKQINVRINIESEELKVLGDPSRLQQILWNLLSNAIKFTPRAGDVQINARRRDTMLEIRVEDSGEGISQEFLPYVFDRFRQADASTARKHGGLGLGLAIVRHLIELHGGTVRAESSGIGQGSSFHILLPTAPEASLKPHDSQITAIRKTSEISLTGRGDLNGKRILVVDDVEDSLGLVGEVLSSTGAKVRLAGSAAEALFLYDNEQFDIIVTDLGMPEQDGFSLLKEIRNREEKAQAPRHPVIALTAYARESDLQKTKAAGFDAHLAKPVSPNQLYKTIANLLGPKGESNFSRNLQL